MANQDLKEFSYLAIVPRGLQSEISYSLQKQAAALVAFDKHDGDDPNTDISDVCGSKERNADDVLKVVTWNKEEDNETLREALRDFSIQKKEKEQRQKARPVKSIVERQPNRFQLEESISSEWLPRQCSVGSVKLSSSKQHVSIGYYPKNEIRDGNHGEEVGDCFAPCMSCTGILAGSVWMQLETDRKDVSQKILAPSRMLGPLLALISVQTDNRCLEASTCKTVNDNEEISHHDLYERFYQHSLEEMTKEVTRHVQSNPGTFSENLDRAFRVWRDSVETTWKDKLSSSEYAELQSRIRDNRLRFRISCMRVEPSIVPSGLSRKRKKKVKSDRELFTYSRQELCLAIMDTCGPQLVPQFYEQPSGRIATKEIVNKDVEGGKGTRIFAASKSSRQGSESWTVNLENFDLELVIFIIPPDFRSKNGKLAFGISLCPYSFLKSRSFASGNIPPDVTSPYLGDIVSKGIVRLRPTTAHLLLRIANLQKYDIVLDPCAGVGTIPVEAEQYHKHFDSHLPQGRNESKEFLSIGGDLILNNPKYTEVAGQMENFGEMKTNVERSTDYLKSSSLLVAWDAAHLPIRTSSVDVVVSDLPFGQQCLSAIALSQLLPLIFLECARVLTPMTGRMVVLAGGSPITLIANIVKYSGKYWKKPISRVSPVSIGGILAWIIRVDRNKEAFDDENCPKRLGLARKIAQKRDRINRQRQSDSGEQKTGKLRGKANALSSIK